MLCQGKDIRQAPLSRGPIGVPQRLHQGGNLAGVHNAHRVYTIVDQPVFVAFMTHAPPSQVRSDLPRGEVNRVAISFGSTKPSAGKRWTECVTASATTK